MERGGGWSRDASVRCGSRQVVQQVGGEELLIASYTGGELPWVSVLPGGEQLEQLGLVRLGVE